MISKKNNQSKFIKSLANKKLGIIGGGQLGKMIAIAASSLGIKTIIYDPDKYATAFQNANKSYCYSYEDNKMLKVFAKEADYITYEFENIPLQTLSILNKNRQVLPSIKALKFSQDRLLEKNFISKLGFDVVPFYKIDNFSGFEKSIKKFSGNAILKTRRLGYDGKGQNLIKKYKHNIKENQIVKNKYIIEKFVKFKKEISVIAIRSKSGNVTTFEPSENIHKKSILRETYYPAKVSEYCKVNAKKITRKIASALGIVGIIAVEMFVCEKEKILVNEIAPRPHNSGHWTLDACNISQFEALVRTIFEIPIPKIKYYHACKMINILGENYYYLEKAVKNSNYKVYIYGKNSMKKSRKLGHINVLS